MTHTNFAIRTYGKSEFALLMFPTIDDPKVAQGFRGRGGQPLPRLRARDYSAAESSALILFSCHRTPAPPYPRNPSATFGSSIVGNISKANSDLPYVRIAKLLCVIGYYFSKIIQLQR